MRLTPAELALADPGTNTEPVTPATWRDWSPADGAAYALRVGLTPRDFVDALTAAQAGGRAEIIRLSAILGATDETVELSRAVLVRVSTVRSERVRWLWADRLPHGKVAVSSMGTRASASRR